jgi:uncharacterized protein YdcH (DUF465 family)
MKSMKIIKVLINFIKLTAAEKITFYRKVILQLTANKTEFANPDSNLDDASKLVDKLETAYENSIQTGGHQATVKLHKAVKKADEVFKILAAYVNRIANGDEDIILLGGFVPSSQPIKYQKAKLKAVDGPNSGMVKLIAKAITNAGSYIWQSAEGAIPADEKDWNSAGHSTQAYITISGFKPGVKYYFRFAAVTPKGVTDFIDPIFKIVL